jgi:hypothetical protein
MPRPKPKLIVHAGETGQRVQVKYLIGDEVAAFDLARRALPALLALAEATRTPATPEAELRA